MQPINCISILGPPGHSQVTHSPHRTTLGGHVRTSEQRHLSSVGPLGAGGTAEERATTRFGAVRPPGFKSRGPDQISILARSEPCATALEFESRSPEEFKRPPLAHAPCPRR